MCDQYGLPSDLSTAVLIDGNGRGHTESASVLRMFPYMGFPYRIIGPLALLLIPPFIRNFGYRMFARNRAKIWIFMKNIIGMGDTKLDHCKDRILGLNEPIDPGWGFVDGDTIKKKAL
jgi:hypothetical protein|mmetsp:Transcript_8627/g.10337  ORF Transcript_8627/g.10337 Transcript_8627/m.10337 type:complete len:118 (+) Transcript_8627:115-468(+)|eukprot:CAMPEP_0195260252 /NCGR_PEP_ID=MMETSP0706-20130129/8467_1 /TAXON_ID=33640 /ORGANISM="Asterionellopsis glacialis, Strain CCMP134" /LENGTH=117 /DNA_ID=CAMNT_0040313943 /DNA_START=343 /DNA_END=696 /DNA_ORIENTATION=-